MPAGILQEVASLRTLLSSHSAVPGTHAHACTHTHTHTYDCRRKSPLTVDLAIDLLNPAYFISFQIGSRLPINAESYLVGR